MSYLESRLRTFWLSNSFQPPDWKRGKCCLSANDATAVIDFFAQKSVVVHLYKFQIISQNMPLVVEEFFVSPNRVRTPLPGLRLAYYAEISTN